MLRIFALPERIMRVAVTRTLAYSAAGVLCVALFPAFAAAQSGVNEQYQLGLTYEQNGDIENAARIYYDIFKSDTANGLFFNDVQRTFLELKRYGALDTIITQRMKALPNDYSLYALLGAVRYHEGSQHAADAAWDTAITLAGSNSSAYREIAATMMQAEAYKPAAACYIRARKTLHDKNAFTSDLAYIYTMLLDYTDAAEEYIRQIKLHQASVGIVESRMGLFTTTPDGVAAALAAGRRAVDNNGDNADLLFLYAWLLIENKSYDEAYDVYQKIDNLHKSGGRDMMAFAALAMQGAAYDASLKAYRAVDEAANDDNLRAWAEFGAASVHERLWLRTNADSLPLAAAVANEYDDVSTKHPKSKWADSSLLCSARIRFEPMFDCTDAAQRILSLITRNSPIARSGEAYILLGKIYTAENLLDSAAIEYHHVFAGAAPVPTEQPNDETNAGGFIMRRNGSGSMEIIRNENTPPAQLDFAQEARYLFAELIYFRGDFDSSMALLKECSTSPKAPYTNNAIEMEEIITENSKPESRDALKQFAQAELLQRQHNTDKALAILENIAAAGPDNPLADRALITEGIVLTMIHQYDQALSAYQKILDAFPESILRDRAQMHIGLLYEEHMHDTTSAISAYEKLLADYPNSIYSDEARKRIIALRGNS